MTHLRIQKIDPLGPDTCSCGQPGCTAWHDDAAEAAAFSGPREHDVVAMAARLRAAEGRPA